PTNPPHPAPPMPRATRSYRVPHDIPTSAILSGGRPPRSCGNRPGVRIATRPNDYRCALIPDCDPGRDICATELPAGGRINTCDVADDEVVSRSPSLLCALVQHVTRLPLLQT